MDIQQALAAIIERQDLSHSQITAVMRQIMGGEATDAQIGGFLIGLRMKGETAEEIAGAAEVMRALASRVQVAEERLVDTCGTGGSGSGKFNVSTAAALVAAAAGAKVAKHGNRAASSKSGSADLLEAAGVAILLSPEEVARCIDTVGLGFLFAPSHHGAMKHAIGPRREMAVRTLFNLLGPLTNPAGARRQLLGVYDGALLEKMAEVLQRLGAEQALVVHSADGLDEISVSAPTRVAELKAGGIKSYEIAPEDFGIKRSPLAGMKAQDPAASLALVQGALSGKMAAAADLVALNAGAAIYVAGLAASLADGVVMAQDAIGSGQASEKLKELVAFTQQLKSLQG